MNEYDLSHYEGVEGFDLVFALVSDEKIRVVRVGKEYIVSLVDVTGIFGMPKPTRRRNKLPNPQSVYKDQKKRLKASNPQLEEKFLQLKMLSPDGKSYLTDVATIEVAFEYILNLTTPAANAFKSMAAGVMGKLVTREYEQRKSSIILLTKGIDSAFYVHHKMIQYGLKSSDPAENADNPTYKDIPDTE